MMSSRPVTISSSGIWPEVSSRGVGDKEVKFAGTGDKASWFFGLVAVDLPFFIEGKLMSESGCFSFVLFIIFRLESYGLIAIYEIL